MHVCVHKDPLHLLDALFCIVCTSAGFAGNSCCAIKQRGNENNNGGCQGRGQLEQITRKMSQKQNTVT